MSEDVRLICGDCREVLPTLESGSVDAIVTDPPYGLGKSDLTWDKKGYKRISEGWDSEVPTAWLKDAYRMLKKGGTLLCFGVWKTFEQILNAERESGFVRRGIVVWDKINTMPNITARGYQYTHEFIVWSTKGGGYSWNACNQERDIRSFTWSQAKRDHPSQKTVPIMKDLILRHTCMGDIVLDPFMGSGTTGEACLRTGRKFIGIEIDPTYFAIAERRLSGPPMPLFETNGYADPVQATLFSS